MRNEWTSIDEKTREKLEEALDQRENSTQIYTADWYEDGQIDEVAFCEAFLQKFPLKCINETFFGLNGMMPDGEVEKEIYGMIKSVLTKGISKKVKQLLEVLRLEAHSGELPVQMDRIHVNNGTYFLEGRFTEEKDFCLNRLPVNYENREPEPGKWKKFLSELLEADDIFLWCLEGLKRLLENNYRFTLSERANRNLHEAMESGNNIIAFMKSAGYIRLETNTSATSKKLYQAYCRWCEDNAEKPMGAKSFSGYLKENEKKYNIRYSTNIPSDNGKSARGFQGIHTQIRTDGFR